MNWLTQNWIWIVLLIAAYFLLFRRRHHGFSGIGGHGMGEAHQHPPAAGDGPATDPVSGRSIDTQHAITTYYGGRVYFFENEENRRRFEAAPEDFVKKVEGFDPAATGQQAEHRHRRHSC